MSTQAQQARPLDIAAIDERFLAVVIDYFVLGLPLGMLFFLFSSIFPNSPLVSAVQGSPPVELGHSLLNAVLFGLALQWLLRPIYFIGLEGYGGQTVGKRIVGIKVVSESTGQVADFGAAIKRNVPRLVLSGFLLLAYVLGLDASERVVVVWVAGIVGLVVMRFTGKNQRLGDKVAHTLVVRE